MSTEIYSPGNPATYNPSTGGNLSGYNTGVASYTGNFATYNPPSGGGLVYWSATFLVNDNGFAQVFEEDPVQIGFQYYPQLLTTPTLPSPTTAYGNPGAGPHAAIGLNIYITYTALEGGPPTPGNLTGDYNAGSLAGYNDNTATYNPVLSGGNPATYNSPTITGYNPPAFTPGNANYTPGNVASFNPTNIATYNPTNISGYNTQNIAGYNAGGGGVNWNATTFYEVERRVSAPGEPVEYSVFVNNVNYESGWSASCPSPITTTNGVINSTSGGLQYYEVNYECTPAGGSGGPNYNTGSIANYIGNTENYNPATVGNYSGNSVNYNSGSAGNYTGNNTAGFAPGGNPASYNTGNPGNYNPTFVGGFSGNILAGYTGNNAGYNTGSPATYTGNNIDGYNPAPPPSYNLGNPASYTSNFVSGYNSGNPATYTGNSIASYSGNSVASYNPGSASTYNFPIPGTPGEPGYAFGVYFPGGGVCAPGVYVNEQEVSYYFENQEIDYRDHPIEVPAGGQIVVRIE
jgi:hypothetical protein